MLRPFSLITLFTLGTLALIQFPAASAHAHGRYVPAPVPWCAVHHRYHVHKKPKHYAKRRRIAYRYVAPVQQCYWHFGHQHCYWAY